MNPFSIFDFGFWIGRSNGGTISSTLAALLLALSFPADAQPPKKVPRIGYLHSSSSSANATRNEAFQQGLRNLGYIEGKNILFEYRYAEGKLERLPDLAAELVRLKVDVIVAGGLPAARAAKQVTTKIPIVMTGGDPVRSGIIESLARPGGNVTGVSDSTVDVSTKRLELLKEVVPKLSRAAILWNPANPTNPLQLKDTQAAAPSLGMTVYSVEVKGVGELEGAFTGIKRERAGGLLVPGDPMFTSNRKRIADLAAKHRLPAMFTAQEYVEAGGLMAYRGGEPRGPVPAPCHVRGQDIEGHQACRLACRAADKV